MSDYFTLDSLLLESETFASISPPIGDSASPLDLNAALKSMQSESLSIKSQPSEPSTANAKSSLASRPFSSLVRSMVSKVLDEHYADSYTDLLERVINKVVLTPDISDPLEHEPSNELSLEIKCKIQKCLIDELSTQIKILQHNLKNASEKLVSANAEIHGYEKQKDSKEGLLCLPLETQISRKGAACDLNQQTPFEHETIELIGQRTACKEDDLNQQTPFEHETIELIEQLKQQSRENLQKSSNSTIEFPTSPTANAIRSEEQGKDAKKCKHKDLYANIFSSRDKDNEIENSYNGSTKITKEMIQETARMIAVAKKFDPPSTLDVGLRTNQKAPTNPYQHLIRTPYQLDATTFRTSSNVPNLARHAYNHENHLSTVLAKQTHELLSTTTPDQYIRVIHNQLQSMLEALHDCIDALAEESHNADRWRVRFDKYKRQIEREEYIRNHKDFDRKIQSNQQRLLNKLFPKVKKTRIEESFEASGKKQTVTKNTGKNKKEADIKSHSRPKYIQPLEYI